MESPIRSETLTSKLIFLLVFIFFPVLVLCHAAFPANQKVVKEDGIEYRAAESVSDETFKRAQFVVYWQEDVLVHEFSHSMMQYLDEDDLRAIEAAYKNAADKELYPKGIYMMTRSGEYWAEGVQAWLGVTLRMDVNGGFNTQQKIRDHDEPLAAVLEKVYGSLQLQHSPGCAY